MNKNNLLMICLIFSFVGFVAFSQSYPYPPLSPKDIVDWANNGGFIASDSAEPTGTLPEGALFVDTSTPTAPLLYRSDGSAWRVMAGAGGSGGVATHSLLVGLSFEDSGHTGFSSAASFSAHADNSINPHGATMTVEQELIIGDSEATPTAFIDSPSAGLVRIASNVLILEVPSYADNAAAITGGLATGTLYRTGDALKIVW